MSALLIISLLLSVVCPVKNVYADDEMDDWLKIGDYYYTVEKDHVIIEYYDSSLNGEDVVIPSEIDGIPVTIIGECALEEAANTNAVYIPKTIKEIRKGAFGNYQGHFVTYYDGTIDDWEKITIYKKNDALIKAFIHYSNEEDLDKEQIQIDSLRTRFIKKDNTLHFGKKLTVNNVKDSSYLLVGSGEIFYILKRNGDLWMFYCNNKGDFESKKIMKNVRELPITQDEIFGDGSIYVVKKNNELWKIKPKMKKKYRYKVIDGHLYMYKISKQKIAKNVKHVYYDSYEVLSKNRKVYKGKYPNIFMLKTDNTLWGMGNNASGELGKGNLKTYKKPVKIMGGIVRFKYEYNSSMLVRMPDGGICLAITEDGNMFAWGCNYSKMIPTSDEDIVKRPIKMADLVIAMDASNYRVAMLRSDGTLWVTGKGIADYGDIIKYMRIDENVNKIDMTPHTVYYIKDNNSLWYYGGGGIAESFGVTKKPKKLLSNVISVDGDGDGGIALKKNGTVWRWGPYKKNKKPKKINSRMKLVK